MFAAMSSTHFKDYFSDIYMDISHQFFPLPSVAVPNIVINRPSVCEYVFESERKAIADYEKNKTALAVKTREMKSTNVVGSKEESNMTEMKSSHFPSVAHMQRIHSNAILEPSPAVTVNVQQQNSKNGKPSVNAFEEFESKPNLFDLLELRTIDDKAALEQILVNSSQPPPTSGIAQSSSKLLPSSSSLNTGLNMSGTDDERNLYTTLPSTLENCGSTVGIGISGASYRQNL